MSAPILLVLRLLLTGLAYAFFGWALWFLWQDFRRQSLFMRSPQAPPITLVPQDAEDNPAICFSTYEVLIGRDQACDYHLEDRTISARHARLAYHHGQWWVEDLDSRNGTFLNGEKVSEAVVITTGDELRCGQVIFQIALGESADQK